MKNPCNICNKSVRKTQKGINDDTYDSWIHIGCNGTTEYEYEQLKVSDNPWECIVCHLTKNRDIIPFAQCDNIELCNIFNTNSMGFLHSLPNTEIVIEATKFVNSSSNEIVTELPSKQCCCNYYSVNDYQHLNNSGNSNIFHTNINGLDSKFDNLHEFLSSVSKKLHIYKEILINGYN